MRAVFAVVLAAYSLAWSSDLFRTAGLNVLDEQLMGPMLGIGLALDGRLFDPRALTWAQKQKQVTAYERAQLAATDPQVRSALTGLLVDAGLLTEGDRA